MALSEITQLLTGKLVLPAKEVMNQLPMEFAVEAQRLLAVSLEGSVG